MSERQADPMRVINRLTVTVGEQARTIAILESVIQQQEEELQSHQPAYIQPPEGP